MYNFKLYKTFHNIKRSSSFPNFLYLFLIIGTLLFLSNTPAFSKDRNPTVGNPVMTAETVHQVFHDNISEGIDLIFNDKYRQGLTTFEKLRKAYPDHPAPYFFKAAAYQTWMNNLRTNKFQRELEENIQLTIDKGYGLLKKRDDPWAYYYIGAAYGYKAVNCFSKHDWIEAYLESKKCIKNLEKALKIDPALYDVYLGLGTYHYWRTAKSKFLRIITFWMPDERELGIRQIELSANQGLYAPSVAVYNLFIAYYDYGKYDKALNLIDTTIAEKEISNISDLYFKGRVLVEYEDWKEVESYFRRVLQHLEMEELSAIGYKVECRYWLALSLAARDKEAEAYQMVKIALSQSRKWKPETELEGPFESHRKILKQLQKLYRELKAKREDRPVITVKLQDSY